MDAYSPPARIVGTVDAIHDIECLLDTLAGELVSEYVDTDSPVCGPIRADGGGDPVGRVLVAESTPGSHSLYDIGAQ